MSKDKIRPLIKAVADLPVEKTGLVLGVVSVLNNRERYPQAHAILQVALNNIYQQKASSKLLEYVDTTEVAGSDEFYAKKELREGRADVRLYINESFKNAFLMGEGKIERNVPDAKLKKNKLLESSRDKAIRKEITKLGDKKETELCQALDFLKKQKKKGWFVFYIYDDDDVTNPNRRLWAVRAHWGGDGWDLLAYSVEHPPTWRDGHLVVSLAKKLKA